MNRSHLARFLEASVCLFWSLQLTFPGRVGLHHYEEAGKKIRTVMMEVTMPSTIGAATV
jgi:hypothetical protein